MFIPDPGSWFLPILDPGSRIQKREQNRDVKINCCHTFFCSHKFHKIVNYFIFEMPKKKKFGPISKELQNFVPKKLSLSSQKYGFGIRDPEKTYSGSRGQKGIGSRIRIHNTNVRVLYSSLLHLPPLRFHCVGGCGDRTQDSGSQTL